MKLKEIYELAVSLGKQYDPRGDEIEACLEREARAYEALKSSDKEYYDLEALSNPYSDTRILNGKGDETVEAVMAGIDIETPEILLADQLKRNGRRIDAVIAHHPEGIAQAALHQVMQVQADMLEQAGVPINISRRHYGKPHCRGAPHPDAAEPPARRDGPAYWIYRCACILRPTIWSTIISISCWPIMPIAPWRMW